MAMPPDPPEMTGDDLFPWLWLVWADAGHERCAGWTFDCRDGLRCRCGALLFVAEVVAA